jgi:hypothetical protein
MYRSPAGAPPTADRCVVVPGIGVGPAIVGRSSAEEILALFGTDCRVSRHQPSGEIFEVSYEYVNDEDYEADRPAQLTRPAGFDFEFGMLKAIEIGVYQEGLATPEGIRIDTPRAEVLRIFGPPTTTLVGESIDTLRYVHLGIDVEISKKDDDVMGMHVFRARW